MITLRTETWQAFPDYDLPARAFDRTMLMGSCDPRDAWVGPQVQAIVQPHGDVIASHFHDVAQFQLIVGGSGFIGRHAVQPGMLRYVDAHRVYGPVRPGPSGLAYLTMRAEHDPTGPFYMPESHDQLADRRPVNPRGLTFDMAALDTCWRQVTYGDPDGFHVAARNLGRKERVVMGMRAGGGFVVVIGGSLEDAGGDVRARWLAAGESLEDAAGPGGARVLRLQFAEAA